MGTEAVDRRDACPHCEPNHGSPHRCAWGVWVAPEVDGDGQPTHLRVQPTNGAHVAQPDADWLFTLIRDRVCVHADQAELDKLRTHIVECHNLQNNIAAVLGVGTDWEAAGRKAVLDAVCRTAGNLADARSEIARLRNQS